MARSRGRQLVQTTRRGNSWEFGPGQVGAETPVTGTVSRILLTTISVNVAGTTLVRIRGEFNYYLHAATATLDGYRGAFGIGIATQAAIASGAASVPTPITEQAWDGWLFWSMIEARAAGPIVQAAVSLESGQVNPVMAAHRTMVDTKAMRKLRVEDGIYACIEVTEVGTALMEVSLLSRMLVKLP